MCILVDDILSNFKYDPIKGTIHWRTRGAGRRMAFQAGSIKRPSGARPYRRIKFMGIEYTASKIAWIIKTKTIPDFIIDHVDGDPINISWENLRRGDNCVSHRNSRMNKPPSSGHTGIYPKNGGWQVYIGDGRGGVSYVGFDMDLAVAIQMRVDAETALHYSEEHSVVV